MPKMKGQKKDKTKVLEVPDADVISSLSTMKPARSFNFLCEVDKKGTAALYKITPNSKVLIAKKGRVDKRNLVMVNLDYPDVKMVLVVGSLGSKMGELFDLHWNPLLYPHLQEAWNERRRLRDIESGKTLL